MSTQEDQLAMGEGQHIEEKYSAEEKPKKQGTEGEGEVKVVENQKPKTEIQNPRTADRLDICPLCNGKGYYDKTKKPDLTQFKRQERYSEPRLSVLPAISQTQQQPYPLDLLYKASESKGLYRMSDSAVVTAPVTKQQTRLPPVHLASSSRGTQYTTGQVRSTPTNLANLLPRKFDKHPEDVARLAAIKLNRGDWETKKAGLEDCLQLAHSYPEELEPHMSLVYRTISSLLNGFHPNSTMFVCQAASEFISHMRSTNRPEYDELVYALLARTADTNRYVRQYANEALDRVVEFIPTIHAVRPMVEKGPIHNNPLVRTATARLLTAIVEMRTPLTILSTVQLRETCKRIIETGALLLSDNNIHVRAAAKNLIALFMTEDEFESVYYAEVDEKNRKRVQRTFIDIKSKIHGQV